MMRRGRWFGIGMVAAAGALILVAVLVLGQFGGLRGFAVRTVDRTGPALLESVRDISQYHAAVGDFQIVIDVEQDVPFVPLLLAGERSLFVAAGTVNVFVDFSGLAGDALQLSPDGTSVRLRLPEPVLDKPNLDQRRTYLFAQQRGALDRILGPSDQQRFYLLAEERIAAAAAQSGIKEQAARNTKAMLIGLFNRLGFQVEFVNA